MLAAGSKAMALCPGDTTEWDDIQRKFGNLPPLEKEVPQREIEQLVQQSAALRPHKPCNNMQKPGKIDEHRTSKALLAGF